MSEEKTDEQILQELISKWHIYKKQKIYYSDIQKSLANDTSSSTTFLDLYEPYKDIMSETRFAKILKIDSSVLSAKKKKVSSQRMIINVFNKYILSEEEKSECIQYVKEKYSLGATHTKRGSGIYYSEVQRDNAKDFSYKGPYLSTMYKELPIKFKLKCSEQEFNNLLGVKRLGEISGPNFKYKATLNIPITDLTKKQKNALLNYLISKYSLYKGQYIYYSKKYAQKADYSRTFYR